MAPIVHIHHIIVMAPVDGAHWRVLIYPSYYWRWYSHPTRAANVFHECAKSRRQRGRLLAPFGALWRPLAPTALGAIEFAPLRRPGAGPDEVNTTARWRRGRAGSLQRGDVAEQRLGQPRQGLAMLGPRRRSAAA